jgi:integration host factor subunit beta
MIKSELVECVMRSYPGLYHRDAEFGVDAVLDAIGEALAKGNRVEIRGFGSFWAKERRSRVERNPQTGHRVPVAAKRAPRFKASKEIREALNNGGRSHRGGASLHRTRRADRFSADRRGEEPKQAGARAQRSEPHSHELGATAAPIILSALTCASFWLGDSTFW